MPFLLGISILLSMAGCLMGPDFEAPDTSMPEAWTSPKAASVVEEEGDIAQWWKQFHDPVLESLVETALDANRDLAVAEARVREARAFRGISAADLRPSGGVSGSYTYEGSPKRPDLEMGSPLTLGLSDGPAGTAGSINLRGENFTIGRSFSGAGDTTSIALTPGSVDTPDRTQDLFATGFDARWELDVFGGVRRGIEAADADVAAAQENLHDVQVILTAEVARNYFELRGAQARLGITQQNIAAQENTLSITTLRFEGGLTSGLDARQAQAQVSLTQSQLPFLEFSVLSSIYRLAVLSGQMPQPLVDQLALAAPLPEKPPVVPIGLPSDLLRRRPDIRRSERQLHAATARVGVAVADLFPRFSMAGKTGASFSSLDSLNLGDAAFWSLGPSIQFPVFDRSRIRANIAVQNARQEAALSTYEQSVLLAMEDAERALASYAKEQARRAALEQSAIASRQAVELANDLYTEGLTDFLNVLQAQGSLFATEDQLVQSEQQILQNLVAIYKAIGGGWAPGLQDAGQATNSPEETPA
jgi:multidrug efflux system outer membrane protein